LSNLELFDVLGEVARGHPLVDVLVAGERTELLDPGLHIVAGDALPSRDRGQVDLPDDGLVVLDDAIGDVDAEILLSLHHRDPEPALQHDLVFGRPDLGQVRSGVPGGQNVGEGHDLLAFSAMSVRCWAPGKLIEATPS
jgi:hypothetical protein